MHATSFLSPAVTLYRREAERDAAAEPLLSSFLYASILAHDTFERALAFVLSNRLANAVMLPTQLFEIFHEVLISDPDVREGALADVEACRERVSARASKAVRLRRVTHVEHAGSCTAGVCSRCRVCAWMGACAAMFLRFCTCRQGLSGRVSLGQQQCRKGTHPHAAVGAIRTLLTKAIRICHWALSKKLSRCLSGYYDAVV